MTEKLRVRFGVPDKLRDALDRLALGNYRPLPLASEILARQQYEPLPAWDAPWWIKN